MSGKIYTRTGDDGTTGVLGGRRLRKDDARLGAVGTVEELNAALGVARTHLDGLPAEGDRRELDDLLDWMQHMLFNLGCRLAVAEKSLAHGLPSVSEETSRWIEERIDRFEGDLPPLSAFILPGGDRLSAAVHFARTVCRRAERECVALDARDPLDPVLLRVVNRLADLLFVLSRWTAQRTGCGEVRWNPARLGPPGKGA